MLIKQQKGLTLIELMIGLLVGAIVAAGAITVFSGSAKNSTDNINLTRLNQDLRAMMDIMERDIRRAGYVTSNPTENDTDGDTINDALMNNPFAEIDTDNSDTCIVYMYNRDYDEDNKSSPPAGPETVPVVDNNERLGFKLVGTELKMRTSSSSLPCDQGHWESLTEPEVEIKTLIFDLGEKMLNITSMMTDADNDGYADVDSNKNFFCDSDEAACNTCLSGNICLYIRTVTITIKGQLKDDPTVTQIISEQVRVRNDKYLKAAP